MNKGIPFGKRIMMFIMALLLSGSVPVWAGDAVPDRVKVGLLYNNPDQATIGLTGYSEIGFGVFNGEHFEEITRFNGVKDITVSKDYAWHIRIGNAPGDWSQYDSLRQTLGTSGQLTVPFYSQGWNAYIGDFISESEASSKLNELKNQFPGLDMTLSGPTSDRVRVLSGQNLIWVYNCNEAEYAFKELGSNPYIKYNGVAYRGGMIVRRFAGSDLTLINSVTMTEYLYGVLPKEMAPDWPLEALKAQAVAARNYAVTNSGKHKSRGFDLCATADCQVYGGYRVESDLCRQAVDETAGRVLLYEGKPVQAFFHSNSGGRTENSENIWTNPLPYIKGVDDSFSVGAPNTDWSVTYTKDEIQKKLLASQMDVGAVQQIVVSRKSENARVLELTIMGSRSTVTLTKEQSRKVLGYNDLKSTWFDVGGGTALKAQQESGQTVLSSQVWVLDGTMNTLSMTPQGLAARTVNGSETIVLAQGDTITFSGHGWGHGLGLSQWGAKAMAERGYNYEQILKYYYTGTILQ